jgi:hypothetical protein
MPATWLTLLAAMATCVLAVSGAANSCDRLNTRGFKFVQPKGEIDCFSLLPSGNKVPFMH